MNILSKNKFLNMAIILLLTLSMIINLDTIGAVEGQVNLNDYTLAVLTDKNSYKNDEVFQVDVEFEGTKEDILARDSLKYVVPDELKVTSVEQTISITDGINIIENNMVTYDDNTIIINVDTKDEDYRQLVSEKSIVNMTLSMETTLNESGKIDFGNGITKEFTLESDVKDTGEQEIIETVEEVKVVSSAASSAPIAITEGAVTVDGEAYDTLSEAIAAAKTDSIVTVNRNLTGAADKGVSGSITINKSLTIDLNGHTIDADGTAGIFTVSSGLVTIKNGTLTNASDSAIKGTGAGATTLNLEGLKITNSKATKGGAVNISTTSKEVTLDVKNCEILNNSATESGGGIYTYGVYASYMGYRKVILNIENTTISGNTAVRGGGIECQSETTLTNVTVSNNKATGTTGYKGTVDSSGSVWTSSSEVKKGGGGGIFAIVDGSHSSKFIINGGSITENQGNGNLGDGMIIKFSGSDTSTNTFEDMVKLQGKLDIANNTGASSNSQIGFILASSRYKDLLKGESVKFIQVEDEKTLSNINSILTICIDNIQFSYEVKQNNGKNYIFATKNTNYYVDGDKGNDITGTGTKENPFASYQRAEKEMIKEYGNIFVAGTLNVLDNETWPTNDWTSTKTPQLIRAEGFTGCMINIGSGNSLTLNNIVIDGNRDAVTSKSAMIENRGILNIHNGAVLQNNLHSHATGASDSCNSGGAVYSKEGTINMDGGLIQNNSTTSYGGGIEIYGGVFNFSGGTIQNNKVTKVISDRKTGWSSGAGVSILYDGRMNMSGGVIKNNTSYRDGAGIGLGADENSTYSYNTNKNNNPATLYMTGGTIEGNNAYALGGGIYVSCFTKAYISGGTIANNKAVTYSKTWLPNYGGGGIYVNGFDNYPNGELYLTNVIVTDNKGSTGGGLAACWTSEVKIYLTDGGAIYDNNGKYEVYINRDGPDEGVYGTYQDMSKAKVDSVDITNYMLGGGAYRWKDENGNYIPLNEMNETYRKAYRLNSDPTQSSKDAAEAAASGSDTGGVWIQGNSSSLGAGGIGSNGTVIIGTPNSEHINIDASKRWDDPDELYTQLLDNVNIWLFRTNADKSTEFVGHQELYYYISNRADHVESGEASRKWHNSVKFQDLPKYDANDNEYDYFIVEEYILKDGTHVWSKNGKAYQNVIDEIMGDTAYIWSDNENAPYKSTTSGDSSTGYEIVNIIQVSVPVEKVWVDENNVNGDRPDSITVVLYANGEELKTLTLSAENDWKDYFTGLDKYDSQGNKIEYTIDEIEVSDRYNKDSITGNMDDGFVITNTYTPATVERTVKKVWNDNDNQDGIRPDSIQVQLYADGEEYGEPVTLTATDWTYTWTDLPEKINGKEVVYTVQEIGTTEGYTTTVTTGEVLGSFLIVNTHTADTVEKTVTKVWDDNDNQDGIRPDSIQVQLYADGEEYGEPVTLTATDWTYTWTDLPAKTNGKEIVYTVKEIGTIDGYTTTVTTGEVLGSFVIVNTHTPEEEIPTTASFVIFKVDENLVFLDGAQFRMIKDDGTIIEPEVTDAEFNARFEFTGLTDGIYTVEEYIVPEGYEGIDPFEVEVKDGIVYYAGEAYDSITVMNSSDDTIDSNVLGDMYEDDDYNQLVTDVLGNQFVKEQVAKTGDQTNITPYVIALSASLVGGLYLFLTRRKKKQF